MCWKVYPFDKSNLHSMHAQKVSLDKVILLNTCTFNMLKETFGSLQKVSVSLLSDKILYSAQ